MTDTRTPEQRRRIMQAVGTRNTAPELIVRRTMHRLGYRFRLHRQELPGTPDIVLVSRRLAVFVHGCFWHGHGCKKGQLPKSRETYWDLKIARNRERDEGNRLALAMLGWKVLTVWECELKNVENLEELLTSSLGAPKFRSTS